MIRLLLSSLLLLTPMLATSQALNPAPQAPVRPSGPEANELDKQLADISDTAQLESMARRFRLAKDADSEGRVWRRLSALRPHVGNYKYQMAAAYAAQDLKSFAYNALLELQAQGYAYDIAKDPRFGPVTSTEVWTYTAEAFGKNREPFGEGKTLVTLPKDDLLLESLAWDPTRKALLVGSAREGAVYIVDGQGGLKPLVKADADNGLWAVFDLAVDAERGVLWIASTAVPHFKRYDAEKHLGRAGIFKFDLKTGKFLKSFMSPTVIGQSFFMSTMALAADGAVYVADGVNNAVYQVKDDQLRRVFHAPVLSSIRGLTVSGDGKTLYFSDYSRGLFGYDLSTGKPFEVLVPGPNLALGGIEGVNWWRGQLVIVQNGMMPKRIMRLKLSADGRQIVAVQPLEANKPELSLPTLATRDGDRLLLIANSQKGQYDRFGLPIDAAKLEGTRIHQLDLNFGQTEAALPE